MKKVMLFSVARVGGHGSRRRAELIPWGEKETSENCWREYPRPQMVRRTGRVSTATGLRDHGRSPTRLAVRKKWEGKIRVPFALESSSPASGLLEPDIPLVHAQDHVCPEARGERFFSTSAAVDFRAMVFIGHDEVTDIPHEGGQNPFTLDVTDT
jgi:hypothetical protein